MTTTNPEVVAWSWDYRGRHMATTDYSQALELAEPPYPTEVEPLIRLADYQRLQADHERLQAECEKLRAEYEEELFQVRQDRDTHFGELMRAIEQVDAMKAECEELRTALAESRANDLTAMGYLNQIRQLVGGDDFPDMVRRCERLQAKCARLQAAMIEAKGHISHYMYGGSSYREPAAEAIAIIDAAMEGDQP